MRNLETTVMSILLFLEL